MKKICLLYGAGQVVVTHSLGPNLDSAFAISTLIFGAFPSVSCTGFPSAQVLFTSEPKLLPGFDGESH